MTLDDVRASLVQLGCPASARGTADSYSIGIPFSLSNFKFLFLFFYLGSTDMDMGIERVQHGNF